MKQDLSLQISQTLKVYLRKYYNQCNTHKLNNNGPIPQKPRTQQFTQDERNSVNKFLLLKKLNP